MKRIKCNAGHCFRVARVYFEIRGTPVLVFCEYHARLWTIPEEDIASGSHETDTAFRAQELRREAEYQERKRQYAKYHFTDRTSLYRASIVSES